MKFIYTFLACLLWWGSLNAQTIIIDNVTGGSSNYTETGVWSNSSVTGYYGAISRVPGNSNDPTRAATFTPNIVTPGIYKVYENHTAATNREEDALFTITDRNGSYQVFINQQNSGANFAIYLGQYEFNAGTAGNVKLNERTNTGTQLWVNADAIKFVYQGPFSGNAEFSANPLSQVINSNISFTDQSTLQGITTWNWSFGDGTTSALQNPAHAYTAAGVYTVTLSVTNASETKSITKTNYITITNPVVPTGNMLSNPGAEAGVIAPWFTYANGPALQVTPSQHKSGSFCFLSANRTQYYHGPDYNLKSLVTGGQLVSGQRYTFSVWVRQNTATAQTITMNLKKVDGSGTKYLQLENEAVPPNTWVKIVKHYVLSITGNLTGLDLYVVTASGTTYDFYCDDFSLSSTEDYTPPVSSYSTDFIRPSGKNLVSGSANTPLLLKGINMFMPSDATDTPEDIWDVKSISQEDFNNISAIGFNSIRLAMNYKIFEDDANPGVFKEDGWHWLDRAIQLAKNAGLKVLLDMHAPQGGYQSDKAQGFSAFWGTSVTDPNTANQNRLIALWTAIADRYKHETAISGFDLINEPRPHNSEEWYTYAEQIIASIRTVDNNHMINLEVPLISNSTTRLVNDGKVIYDTHMYTPWEYAIQYSAAYSKGGVEWGKYDPANPVYVKYLNGTLTVVAQGTTGAVAFNKAYLQNALTEDILQFASSSNVPVNVGEWGLCWEMFNQNVGALTYMEDFTGVFDGDNAQSMPVSRFYFAYHGAPFSIYYNWNGFQTNETEVNTPLKNFFTGYFAAPAIPGNTQTLTSGDLLSSATSVSDIQIQTSGRTIRISGQTAITAVEVFDLTGRVVASRHPDSGAVIRIDAPTPGMYLVRLTTTDGLVTKKVALR